MRINTSSKPNGGGTTIYCGAETNPEKMLHDLSDKSKTTSRNRLSEMQFVIIDKLTQIFNLI